MNSIDTKASPFPDKLDKKYFRIVWKALEFLNRIVDGNGLKAGQISVKKQDTKVHYIKGGVVIEVTSKIAQGRKGGNEPYGQVLESKNEVIAFAEGLHLEFLKSGSLHREILDHLKQLPGQGWGMKPIKMPVPESQKEFSVIEKCPKCEGQMRISCVACSGTGVIPCKICYAKGMIPCQACRSTGYVQQDDGSQVACLMCKGLGRVLCHACRNIRNLPCTICGGKGSIGCSECAQSGYSTQMFTVTYEADIQFDLFDEKHPPFVLEAVNKLGSDALGVGGHAGIFYHPAVFEKKKTIFPLTALLPIAIAELSIGGKIYPAVIAGLNARVVKIESFMDAMIKPGINALLALTKNPKEPKKLVDAACKYNILRQTLSALTNQSKRTVTQKIFMEYPEVLSEKYVNASVKYADKALLTLGKSMRIRGLVIGTILSYGLSLLYYVGPVKAKVMQIFIQKNLAQFGTLVDVLVWILGYIVTIYMIKIMAAHTLRKFLPDMSKKISAKLPAAGIEGIYAIGTTLLVLFAANMEFMTALFKKLGL
ncbi:MAG: hypothetical protein KAS59_01445 [Alphaproteobacteria bacterium]|nr:hypothetical protein [Alphaproteobacteria bacterium]